MKKKVMVIGLIVVAIIAVWFFKNSQKKLDSPIKAEVASADISKLKALKKPVVLYVGSECCSTCDDVIEALNAVYDEIGSRGKLVFVNSGKLPGYAEGLGMTIAPSEALIAADGSAYIPSKSVAATISFKIHYDEKGKADYTIHEGSLTKSQLLRIFEDMGY